MEKLVSDVLRIIVQISLLFQISTWTQVAPEEKLGGVKEVNGTIYGEDIILGVPIHVPV